MTSKEKASSRMFTEAGLLTQARTSDGHYGTIYLDES